MAGWDVVVLSVLLGAAVPLKYVTQMLWQMRCTERAWCDFVSYDPRMPEEMRLFVKRLHFDERRVVELEKDVREFLTELDGKVAELTAAYGVPRAA